MTASMPPLVASTRTVWASAVCLTPDPGTSGDPPPRQRRIPGRRRPAHGPTRAALRGHPGRRLAPGHHRRPEPDASRGSRSTRAADPGPALPRHRPAVRHRPRLRLGQPHPPDRLSLLLALALAFPHAYGGHHPFGRGHAPPTGPHPGPGAKRHPDSPTITWDPVTATQQIEMTFLRRHHHRPSRGRYARPHE
jgi:hypothetical protein